MNLTRQARTALKKSIAHWQRLATGKQEEDEGPFRRCCPLCAEFNDSFELECNGCPVRDKTGKAFCHDTPYWKANFAWDRIGSEGVTPFKKAAREELKFLKSLLPKTTKQ